MRRVIAFALIALCAGCGDKLLAPVQSCAGEWVGTQNGYNLGLSLSQTDSTVTGTMQITGLFGFAQGDVSGVCPSPNVKLTFTITGSDPINYAGTLSSTAATINAKLNGSGFTNLELNVNKR